MNKKMGMMAGGLVMACAIFTSCASEKKELRIAPRVEPPAYLTSQQPMEERIIKISHTLKASECRKGKKGQEECKVKFAKTSLGGVIISAKDIDEKAIASVQRMSDELEKDVTDYFGGYYCSKRKGNAKLSFEHDLKAKDGKVEIFAHNGGTKEDAGTFCKGRKLPPDEVKKRYPDSCAAGFLP